MSEIHERNTESVDPGAALLDDDVEAHGLKEAVAGLGTAAVVVGGIAGAASLTSDGTQASASAPGGFRAAVVQQADADELLASDATLGEARLGSSVADAGVDLGDAGATLRGLVAGVEVPSERLKTGGSTGSGTSLAPSGGATTLRASAAGATVSVDATNVTNRVGAVRDAAIKQVSTAVSDTRARANAAIADANASVKQVRAAADRTIAGVEESVDRAADAEVTEDGAKARVGSTSVEVQR